MQKVTTWLDQLASLINSDSVIVTVAVKAILAFSLAGLAWLVIKVTLSSAQKRLSSIAFVRINQQIFRIARKTLALLLFFILGSYLLDIFQLQMVQKPLQAILILLCAGPVKEFLLLLLRYLEKNVADKTETQVDNIIFDLLNKFSSAIIYSIAVVIALDALGINVMPFIAGAGVLGVAIGFAAKDTLSNLIAGVLLIIDRPFEIGDRIEVWSAPAGSATWGDVIDIGLRATRIKTTDNIVIVIPNNEIMKRDIVNYTIISSNIRVRINIGVAYDADIAHAKEVICDVADQLEWVLKTPAPKVMVRNFGESSVDLQLRVWISDARKRMDTISSITDAVKTAFDREGIEIPYPKRDVHIIAAPTENDRTATG